MPARTDKRILLLGLAAVVAGAGCKPEQGTADAGISDGGAGVRGVSLMSNLAGLWAGAAATTPLGPIPLMNMDYRPVGADVLFGRVDLDNNNNLRFELAIEDHGGPVLVFRNGGYFLGILRDSRTQLIDYDPSGPAYRFCSIPGGCDYIDASFGFTDAAHFTLNAKVLKQPHLLWSPERKETRTVPSPFPSDSSAQPGDAPFPPMPRLLMTVNIDHPPAKDADVLVVLSATPCDYLHPAQLGCSVSRSLFGTATAGSSSTSLVFDQIHPGTYSAVAILDLHGTLKQRLMPQSGDGISLPNKMITIAPSGDSSATVAIALQIP